MTVTDFIPSIKGAIIAAFGWIIASVESFGMFFQGFPGSRIEVYDAWISLAIKGVTLITGIVLFYYNINKIIKQRRNMTPDEGNDNESGQGGPLDPQENDDDK